MNANRLFSALGLLSVVVLAACGGNGTPDGADAAAMAIDTSIVTNIPREPLTEEDLAGMDLADLSVELPWTANIVSRDPGPAAARSAVVAAEASGHEGFDRVTFTFSESTPFPGYEIRVVEAGHTFTCGEQEQLVETDGERALWVRLHPARANEQDRQGPRLGVRSLGQDLFTEGGPVCDDGEQVVWVAGLTGGDQVRVLEFRNPNRLIVDIR